MLSLRGGLLLSTAAAASLLPRQDGCTNQTNLDTDIGLKFDNYCLVNVANHDLRNHDSPNLTACLNACANSGADPGQAPCRAVAFNTNVNRCWQKSGNATLEDAVATENTIMAFAQNDPWVEASHGCPYTNGSIQTDQNGMQYQILCDTRHKGNNFDPDIREAYQPFHAATMEECMKYCSDNSPLCYGVLYSEGLDVGYRNCWAKNKNATTVADSLVSDGGSATAIGLLSVNSTCAGSTYTAGNSAQFNTSCDMGGSGPDIKRVHTSNFEECIDECANYRPQNGNSECRNAMYQPNSEDGFLNCYLKYGLDNVTSQAQWHLAVLASSGSGPGGDDDSGSNAGLIAGAVVGPVVGIALIAGAVFWWLRRRRAARSVTSQDRAETEPFKSSPGAPSYAGSPCAQQQGIKHDYAAAESTRKSASSAAPTAPIEMDSGTRHTRELPGSEAQRYEMQG